MRGTTIENIGAGAILLAVFSGIGYCCYSDDRAHRAWKVAHPERFELIQPGQIDVYRDTQTGDCYAEHRTGQPMFKVECPK